MNKEYIGDGVYVEFDGYGIILTTENGISTTNTVYLEPEVFNNLESYVDKLKEKLSQEEQRKAENE